MPILNQWEFALTVNDVLRAQGADPEVIAQRRPALVKAAEDALNKGIDYLHPLVLYERYSVSKFVHERVELKNGSSFSKKPYLSGSLIAQHFARAQEVIVLICTIGNALDDLVGNLFKVDPLAAIALDGVGSAAVENLAIQACNYFEEQVNLQGLNTSIPLNPGLIGWPVEQGQLEIFSLLDSETIHVTLNESCMMIPNKSLSMVLGVGKDVSPVGTACDYCSLKDVCKYQHHDT